MGGEKKKEEKKSVDSYILRDFEWYEKQKGPWTQQLFNLSRRKDLRLTEGDTEALIQQLLQLAKDDVVAVKRHAVFALANLSGRSQDFVSKYAEMGGLDTLLSAFLDYDSAILYIVGAFCRLCRSEDVVFLGTKLRFVDFLFSCLGSLEQYLIVAACRTIYDMVGHIKLLLDLANQGLFSILALLLMDDLPGRMRRTAHVLAVVRRASEHGQPVPHLVARSGCLGLVTHFVTLKMRLHQKLAMAIIMNIGLINLHYITPLYAPEFFSDLIILLMFDDIELKFYASNIIRRMTETSKDLTRMLLEDGLMEALLYVLQTPRYSADPCLLALSNVLDLALPLTKHFVELKGHLILTLLLYQDNCEFVLFAVIQILNGIFNRGPPYNQLIANLDIYERLVELYRRPSSSLQLRTALSNTCRHFLRECTDSSLIKGFFIVAPAKQLAFVVHHFAQVLPTSLEERQSFLQMDGLLRLNQMVVPEDDPAAEAVEVIKACFPPDVVNYYSPEFANNIMRRVHKFPVNNTLMKKIGLKKWGRISSEIDEEDEN